MKPRRFHDTMMPLFIVIEIVFGLFGIVFLTFIGIVILYFASLEFTLDMLFYAVMIWGMDIYWILGFCLNPLIYNRAFGRLLVYEDKVVYKCFLRKNITMKIEEIKHAGVEDFHLLNRGVLKFRGDEDAFVYLSTSPFPDEYRGKVTLLKNKKGFIKFTYSDKLAEALIDILPAEKDNLIRAFYGKMKAQDMLNKQQKRKNKKN